MTISMSILPEVKIASANFGFGGFSRETGSKEHWEKTISALRAWQPHIVLCQEISALTPGGLTAHLWATANALGMIPLLGPPTPISVTGNHPAILISTRDGLAILDAGPATYPPGSGTQPAWCEALVDIPGWAHPLHARSSPAARQRRPAWMGEVTQAAESFGDRWIIRQDRGRVTATSRADRGVVLTAGSPGGVRDMITAYERSRSPGSSRS